MTPQQPRCRDSGSPPTPWPGLTRPSRGRKHELSRHALHFLLPVREKVPEGRMSDFAHAIALNLAASPSPVLRTSSPLQGEERSICAQ